VFDTKMYFLILCCILYTVASHLQIELRSRQTNTLSTSAGRFMDKTARTKLPGYNAAAPWRIPIFGNLTYWGEFYALVGIGTPPQYVQLQVDTGSTDLIVYSKQCTGCNATATYDYTASSTADSIDCMDGAYICNQQDCENGPGTCNWEDDYGDGASIQGHVVTDLLTLGGQQTSSTASLGPITSVYAPGGFEAFGVNGIWGFAFQPLSGWQGYPAVETIVSDFSLYDSFDLCLYVNNGLLNIGKDYSNDTRFQWAPIQEDQWYTIYVNDFRFGGVSLNISTYDLNENGVIVDSGTTLIIVSTQIMGAIKSYLNSLCSRSRNLTGICGVPTGKTIFDGQCFHMNSTQVNQYPNMTVIMYTSEEVSFPLTIYPQTYLWQGAGQPNYYCMGIQGLDGGLPTIIFGDVFIQNYHVVFDRYADRVGFGPLSSC